MKFQTLDDVFQHEVEDLHSAESQLIEALPKMAKGAMNQKLQKSFSEHFKQTQQHVVRLEKLAQQLEIKLPAATCKGMEGLIKEGSEILKQGPSEAADASLISAAQRIEHYEMAGYGSAIAFAKELGYKDLVKVLKKTFDEEVKTDQKLSTLAEKDINPAAKEAA